MNNVELYINNNKPKALKIKDEIEAELKNFGYNLLTDFSKEKPDLTIGLGGDGTLLKWLNQANYYTKSKYLGINCGTLGFMQDFEAKNISDVISNIPNYVEENLHFVELKLITTDKKKIFLALNEFNILNNHDKSLRINVDLDGEVFETFFGTGLLFSSPTGSTAQNISSVGSIMYPGIEAIQMTPSEPIINRKLRCLPKSICIPKNITVNLRPVNKEEIKIIADGRRLYQGTFENIEICYSNSYLTKLTNLNNSFVTKVREKLI